MFHCTSTFPFKFENKNQRLYFYESNLKYTLFSRNYDKEHKKNYNRIVYHEHRKEYSGIRMERKWKLYRKNEQTAGKRIAGI